MGAFFTNCHVRTDKSPAAVRKALKPLVETRAYLAPPKEGWFSVYDEAADAQDEAALRRVAAGLSAKLKAPAIAFLVHDSDVLVYFAFRDGQLVDEFNSAPDYFGNGVDEATRTRVRGDAAALLPLCVGGVTLDQVEEILHPPDGEEPGFAEAMLSDVARVLGIDEPRAVAGFRYVEDEGEALLPDAGSFELIGKRGTRRRTPPVPPGARDDSGAAAGGESTCNLFGPAVASLCMGWPAEGPTQLPPEVRAAVQKQFDRDVPRLLAMARVADAPTFEELKAARDAGPAALAELLAERVPELLVEVGVCAAAGGNPDFVAALLARGLDPLATGSHGMTALQAAERHGLASSTYRLLKSAADAPRP